MLVGAAGAGFLRAAHWAGEAALLASFCQALARMAGEIRCNQTRLPPLCRQLARELTGPARKVFEGEFADDFRRDGEPEFPKKS